MTFGCLLDHSASLITSMFLIIYFKHGNALMDKWQTIFFYYFAIVPDEKEKKSPDHFKMYFVHWVE